ncbi:hypothetical protein GGR53DRAFT_527780 [Hypoxylon sp. FL1150]|nr:hypothetical protein GGR53DRAFT_527780 [Hypoxylon sp. FL1150]
MSRKLLITVIRNAEALHNLQNDWDIPDPNLTTLGVRQCADLFDNLPEVDENTLYVICCSPSKRSIVTTLLGTSRYLSSTPRGTIYVMQQLREVNGTFPCNIGTDLPSLEREFGKIIQPYCSTPEEWKQWGRVRDYNEIHPRHLEARATALRKTIQSFVKDDFKETTKDIHVYIVTHGEFMTYLVDDYMWRPMIPHAQIRTYEFEDSTLNDSQARFKETLDSREKRSARVTSDDDHKAAKTIIDGFMVTQYNEAKRDFGVKHNILSSLDNS